LRVYKDPIRTASFLEPFANHIRSYGLGTSGEIFDGDAPFSPRGCVAQAWTVGELLRAWTATVSAALAAGLTSPAKNTRKDAAKLAGDTKTKDAAGPA
jgi:glycogen debranching enzyme